MAEFAFLFYAGDYLRDTQCLSEKSQVAYDRVMCEHMRNICITQQQLNFFTKRLNDAEKEELLSVLVETEKGFHIEWVVSSIMKRQSYSESRRKNRLKKDVEKKITYDNDMKTYDEHMEIEIEIEKEIVNKEIKENLKNIFFSENNHISLPEQISEQCTTTPTENEIDKIKLSDANVENLQRRLTQNNFELNLNIGEAYLLSDYVLKYAFAKFKNDKFNGQNTYRNKQEIVEHFYNVAKKYTLKDWNLIRNEYITLKNKS